MKIATMDTAERNGQAARAGHPFVAARRRAGNAWVVCLTDAAGSADEERAGAAAALANQAFLEACRAYEGLQAGTRLQEALLHANDQLDNWWEEQEGERTAVALTAVELGEAGADYLAVGDGTVVVFDAEGPTVLRRGLQDRTNENGPRTGLRGSPLSPDNAERGRYPTPPNPKGVVVVGSGFLGSLDDEAFRWTGAISLQPRQLVAALVDAVSEETRNRRPGVHVYAVSEW